MAAWRHLTTHGPPHPRSPHDRPRATRHPHPARHGTGYARLPLADGHALTLTIRPGAHTADAVYLFDGLPAPGTEAWENADDVEPWLTTGSFTHGPRFLDAPLQAVREHGGEHADQD
ncbi:hypothetical protein [Streptomyces sp. NPDC059003]|uniref:hypothetical protein n=1 Tax=Streptomyces sp. NPDC059003 TaxID=3346691 RepID=UPI0036914F40